MPHSPSLSYATLYDDLRRTIAELRRIRTELHRILYWSMPHPSLEYSFETLYTKFAWNLDKKICLQKGDFQ